MKPVLTIGLTYTGSDEKHNNYVNWIKGNDDIEVVTLSAEYDNLDAVKDLDGIVLSGGVDIHPKLYTSDIIDYPNAPESFNEARDRFEQLVFEESQLHFKPLLAICRGMQLINCLLGGSLTQDLGVEPNRIHRCDKTDNKHNIRIEPKTIMSEVLNGDVVAANSAHHQALGNTGKGLKINAVSEDGVAEGLEWEDKTGKPFFLAVQWHPERMYKLGLENLPASKKIKERFIEEVLKSTETKK